MTAETHLFHCLQDNYGVLLHDKASGATAAIDAPEAAPVDTALSQKGWKLTDIFVTHHHADHTGGIAELKKRHGCRVTAPRAEAQRIPLVDETVTEGTPEMMWTSLLKLRNLPGDTRIYCGHEYTLANIRFAQTIEPDNLALIARAAEAAEQMAQHKPTIPTTLDSEKAANPFLRADLPELAEAVGMAGKPAAQVFAEVRARKNKF